MQFVIKQAATDKEKEAIYRLRYQVYVEEYGIQALANPFKILTDQMDQNGILFYTMRGDEIVGTIRYNIGPFSDPELLDIYNINSQYSQFYPERISTTTRLIVKKEFRSSPLAYRLTSSVYQYGLENGVYYDFISVFSRHIEFYERLGFKKLGKSYIKDGNCLIPMILEFRNFEFLTEINSPLRRIVKLYLQTSVRHNKGVNYESLENLQPVL